MLSRIQGNVTAADGKVKGTDESPSTWSLPPLPDFWTYLQAWPQQFSLDFHGAFWSDCGTNLWEEAERFESGEFWFPLGAEL